jgi:hypothetical protein
MMEAAVPSSPYQDLQTRTGEYMEGISFATH